MLVGIGGGEAQPECRRRDAQMVVPGARLALGGVGEVMRLIEHDEGKALAPALEKCERRVVGGDRERADFLLVAVPGAHALGAERIGELREPLRDERAGWRHDAGARADVVDGQKGHQRLPGAGGEDHRPATAGGPPCIPSPPRPYFAIDRASASRAIAPSVVCAALKPSLKSASV